MTTSYNFPTRHWPYRRPAAAAGVGPPAEPPAALPPGALYRFVIGLDPPPGRAMSAAERAALNDPLATLLLRRGQFPLSLRTLLAALDQQNAAPDGLPEQLSFVIAEGGQIPFSPATATLNRGFRFVIARGRGGSFELFVSTSVPFDSERQFLQVLAWDPVGRVFQYYERRDGSWFLAGSSWDALAEPTRGQGPFDSHVNGAMVMKELQAPWLHWDSMAQTIPLEALAPDDPLRTEPLFTGRSGGQLLEPIVRRGVDRWTQARLDRLIGGDGRVQGVTAPMRQVLTTTTVNIASASQPSAGPDADPLRPPLSLFFNNIALINLLGLEPDFERPTVSRGRYRAAAQALNLRLIDSQQQPPFEHAGDVFFAWAVPEPAFEDLNVLDHLLRQGLLSRRFAASLLMVDFTNPIGSQPRGGLLRWVPDEAEVSGAGSIEGQMTAAIEMALPGLAGDAPERALLADLALAENAWEAAFAARIEAFMTAVQSRLEDDDGLLDLMRLADSRRREFRRRPLAEFDLSLPWTDIPRDAPFLRLDTAARLSTDL
jgi:hypothetical protein